MIKKRRVQYRPTHTKHLFRASLKTLLPPRMQAQILSSPLFLIASQEYCTCLLFPPFLVSSAVISSYFLRQSLLFSSPFCGRCMCVSACCCTATVVHTHDPMTKGRGGCRECQSPVHWSTPLLPDADTFRGTGKCRISQLYRYVCTVRTDRRPLPVPTSNPSYHREHDIDRFLATPLFLIVLLLLRPFLTRKFFQEILGLEGSKKSWEKKHVSYEEIFRQNFLAQNFLRKFWLGFSYPRKFWSPKFPGDKRKFYQEILGSLDNRTEFSTVCVFLCSHWSLVDVPLIFFCPADHVPDWQPRVLLGMVEARSVNVKKTTTTTLSQYRMMPAMYTQLTVFSAVLTHASSHTNVAPRTLTNARGRTAVLLAGMMIDVFCFQSGLVT